MGYIGVDVRPIIKMAIKVGHTREEAQAQGYEAMLPGVRSPRIRRRLLARIHALRGPDPKDDFATLRLKEDLIITRWRDTLRWWNPFTWCRPI